MRDPFGSEPRDWVVFYDRKGKRVTILAAEGHGMPGPLRVDRVRSKTGNFTLYVDVDDCPALMELRLDEFGIPKRVPEGFNMRLIEQIVGPSTIWLWPEERDIGHGIWWYRHHPLFDGSGTFVELNESLDRQRLMREDEKRRIEQHGSR